QRTPPPHPRAAHTARPVPATHPAPPHDPRHRAAANPSLNGGSAPQIFTPSPRPPGHQRLNPRIPPQGSKRTLGTTGRTTSTSAHPAPGRHSATDQSKRLDPCPGGQGVAGSNRAIPTGPSRQRLVDAPGSSAASLHPPPPQGAKQLGHSSRATAASLPAAFAFAPACSAANGSAGAPLGASASSSRLTACSCWRWSSLTTGYRGSISIRVCTITAAAQIRANHLWSAGITYHGAQRVLVADSICENALW